MSQFRNLLISWRDSALVHIYYARTSKLVGKYLGGLALSFVILLPYTENAIASDDQSYILATATTGGTYYPVGVALATLVKIKLEPKEKISLSAISSAGSGENVKLLREKQAQFAILQGLYGAWAWSGEGRVKAEGKQENLRAVSMLWQNVEHFVLSQKLVKSGTIADLNAAKGKKFSIGKRNSGTEGSGRQILSALGIDPDAQFSLVYQGYGSSAQSLQRGGIVGMNTPAGVPVSAVARAFAGLGDKIRVLDFADAHLAKVNQEYPLWSRYVIPENTYPAQKLPINTIAQPNFLAVNNDIPKQTVYLITKTIYENLVFLQNIHKATSAMSIEKSIAGLPIPLHEGALQYYQEQGIEIPAALKLN